MAPARKNFKGKRARKVLVPKRTKAPVVSKAIKKYVSYAITKKAETKFADPELISDKLLVPYLNDLGTDPANVGTLLNMNDITQGITQGVGQGQRIGNRITIKKAMFKGYLSVPDYKVYTNNTDALTQAPRYVKMVLFRQKISSLVPTSIADLFQDGNTERAPANNLFDMLSYFNTDKYTILKTKVFKLGSASPDVAATYLYQNNDFRRSIMFKMDITKLYPKILKYDDLTARAQNTNLYCIFLHAFADGHSISAQAPVYRFPETILSYTTELTFADD